MRKCASCGYLLFGDGETCNHCGAAVQLATAPVTPAPAPSETATSAPAATRPAPEPVIGSSWRDRLPSAPPPLAPGPASPFRSTSSPFISSPPIRGEEIEMWRPPEPVGTTRTRSAPRARTALIVVMLVVLGGAGYRFYVQRGALPAGTSEYVAGKGVDYTAADGSYSARFPKDPEVEQQTVTVNSVTVTVTSAIASTGDYEVGTGTILMPMTVARGRVDSFLEGGLKGGVSNIDGKLVSKQRTERGGLPAIAAKVKTPDGYSARVLVMLAGSRIYLLYAHAKTGTDKLFETLDASFVPGVLA